MRVFLRMRVRLMGCYASIRCRKGSAEGVAGPSQYMQFPRPAEINLLLVEQARAASGTAAGSRVAESAKASTSGGCCHARHPLPPDHG